MKHSPTSMQSKQAGLGLVELMIGIAIGLLVVATGLGALIVSRVMTGTVGDASNLQQQASYAFRIIGQQIRQSGGRSLKPVTDPIEYGAFDDLPALATYIPLQGKSEPGAKEYALEVLYQNAEEKAYPLVKNDPQMLPLLRNCLGEEVATSVSPVVTSKLRLTGDTLVCAGSGAPQSIVSGVADFQVRYLRGSGVSGAVQEFSYAPAESLLTRQDWLRIYAVEVCLELVGSQRTDTAGATYTRCDKSEAPRGDKLRMVFRNTFYINNRIWNSAS